MQRIPACLANCNSTQLKTYDMQLADVLRRGSNHESLLCTAACILGEYGRLVQVRACTCMVCR